MSLAGVRVICTGFLDNIALIAPLMKASYLETEDTRLMLGVDIYTFGMWEKENRLITVMAMEGEQAVGVALFNLYDNVHHKDLVFAESRIIYVAPAARSTQVAKVMIAKVEEIAKALGVIKLHIGSRKESRYFERLGYEKDQVTYTKFLGESL